DINFQRVPTVDTSNPFIARFIPTPDESMVVIRFRNPRGIDFPYLVSMIHNSFMSRANSIVIPGGKLDLPMQLILTPLILNLVERRRRAFRSQGRRHEDPPIAAQRSTEMDDKAKPVTGKERYRAGVIAYKKMGYWQPDYEPKDTDIIALFRV